VPSPTVYISGCHSDPNPSPGVGLARSLRVAFPGARLIAVDYSVRSSGLHFDGFDDACVHPVWSELDLEFHAGLVRTVVGQPDTCWISGLDVEIDWLTGVGHHPRLLTPHHEALVRTRKPTLLAAAALGMGVPKSLPATAAPEDLHRLGRRAGWRLWVKGMYHEAYPALSFHDIAIQVESLRRYWDVSQIFVQEHVAGTERAYPFASYQGRLLGVVEVEKRMVTGQGKTWAAAVSEPEGETVARIEAFVADTQWSGGGEIEFVRAAGGDEWLIDFNPRFPAYVHGLTICGHNLAARLVAAAIGLPPPSSVRRSNQFVRVVQEIPIRDDLPLPPLVPIMGGDGPGGKHPSHQPYLAKALTSRVRPPASPRRPAPVVSLSDEVQPLVLPTTGPQRERCWDLAERVLDLTTASLARLSGQPKFQPALSVKTDPSRELATRALTRGWWAEAISLAEVIWAEGCGFPADAIVFNGPAGPTLGQRSGPPLAAVFADSTESLSQLAGTDVAQVVGARFRLPSTRSRFGIDISDYSLFSQMVHDLSRVASSREYGIHFHVASDVSGPSRWFERAGEAVEWTRLIAELVGRPPQLFDLGGGWHHEDWEAILLPALVNLQTLIRAAIPGVERVVLEPGKAISGPSAILRTHVLEVREREDGAELEVVVTASIADLPMATLNPHSIILVRDGRAVGRLAGGEGRVLGNICMENDVLAAGVSFPLTPRPGDELVFGGAGGYNASMAWPFAAGISRDA
jgi:diaminopimelate decarboxylase